jgi:hypothetical protein
MEQTISISFYLHLQWLEEDGDGFNLVIMDSRRKSIQNEFEEQLKSIQPISTDKNGNHLYPISLLNKIWDDVKLKIDGKL